MRTSDQYIDYILDILSDVKNVTTKRMFGGSLVQVNNEQLGIICDNQFFLKVVDEALQQQLLREGSHQFSYARKEKNIIIKNWWSVPPVYLEDREKMLALSYESLSASSLK
ncbi:hypothetical protein COB57_00310 [Candidatus Peregrinibacteria bacterium]|nr:MAG: hypothetical protein COB57_00310 [Candidatus Peregrinibacteria bacterium]